MLVFTFQESNKVSELPILGEFEVILCTLTIDMMSFLLQEMNYMEVSYCVRMKAIFFELLQ